MQNKNICWENFLENSLKKVIIAENDLKGQSATKIFGNWLNPKFSVLELKKRLVLTSIMLSPV